jgi:hypothetical protein
MILRIAGLIAVLVLASGCAATGGGPPSAPSAPAATAAFRTADFAWSKQVGRGRIDGQLVYAAGKQAYTCANSTVVLTPETPWVSRRMTILYNSDKAATLPADEVRSRTPPERSQDYSAFARRTTCDAAEHFSFLALPDGTWFVITVAKPTTAGAGRDMAIMRRVTIRNGEAVKLRL